MVHKAMLFLGAAERQVAAISGDGDLFAVVRQDRNEEIKDRTTNA
jgi:hypothetical protein